MKYIIIDWFSNVCFDSHEFNLTNFDEDKDFLEWNGLRYVLRRGFYVEGEL